MLEKIAGEQSGVIADIRSNLIQILYRVTGAEETPMSEPPSCLVDFEKYLLDMLVEIKDYTERLKEII